MMILLEYSRQIRMKMIFMIPLLTLLLSTSTKFFTSIVYKCAPFKNAMQNGSTPSFSGKMLPLQTEKNEAWTCQAYSPA